MNSRTKKRNLRIKDDARSVSPGHNNDRFSLRTNQSVEPSSEKHRTSLKNELCNFLERKQSTFVRGRSEAHPHLVLEKDVRTC